MCLFLLANLDMIYILCFVYLHKNFNKLNKKYQTYPKANKKWRIQSIKIMCPAALAIVITVLRHKHISFVRMLQFVLNLNAIDVLCLFYSKFYVNKMTLKFSNRSVRTLEIILFAQNFE